MQRHTSEDRSVKRSSDDEANKFPLEVLVQPWLSGVRKAYSNTSHAYGFHFLRSWLEGSHCPPPPQCGTGYGEMDDIPLTQNKQFFLSEVL